MHRRPGGDTVCPTEPWSIPTVFRANKNFGDPKTFQEFLQWGMRRYLATNYFIVGWGHGTGFRPAHKDIIYDAFGSSLDMSEMQEAFTQAGIGPKKKIAILGFDACLMNMLEIAHHFRDQVEILIGSQHIEPRKGWPYDKVLQVIKKFVPQYTTRDLAKKIVTEYVDSYRKEGVFGVTQSAIDTSKTEAAIRALNTLGELLAHHIENYRQEIRKIRLSVQEFEMADYIDLMHLTQLIPQRISDSVIVQAAQDVYNTVDQCILVSDKHGRLIQNAHGLSIWFPRHKELYSHYRRDYLTLQCNSPQESGWVRFLDAYYA